MKNEIIQPFAEQPSRHPDDSELVEKVLGTEQADEMRALVDEKTPSHQTSEDMGQLELNKDEDAATTEAEESFAEVRRNEYITWATAFGNEKWVDETFIFNTDGTVVTEGDVDLCDLEIDSLPPKLTEVNGDLDLRHNQITSLESLPSTVSGDIYLSFNQIISLEGLPSTVDGYLGLGNNQIISLEGLPNTVGGDLYLNKNPITSLENLPITIGENLDLCDIPATSIPEGLSIGGIIRLSLRQTELIADCRAKGYNIDCVS